MQTQVVLNCSALPCLLHLLNSSRESIRKEACWTVSNITAGNPQQIQVIIIVNKIFYISNFETLNNVIGQRKRNEAYTLLIFIICF